MHYEYFFEFLELARQLSFSRAAEKLFISQSSLSKHISVLEDELGVKLVDRTTRSVTLTTAGRFVFEEGLKIESTFAYIRKNVGTIRPPTPIHIIGMISDPLISQRIARAVQTVNEKGPRKIRVLLEQPTPSPSIFTGLETGDIDLLLTFRTEEERPSYIFERELYRDQLYAVISPSSPLASHKSLKFSDLKPYPFIRMFGLNSVHEPAWSQIETYCEEGGFSPDTIIMQATSYLDWLSVSLGDAVLINAYGIILESRLFHDDRYVCIPLKDSWFTYCVYWNDERAGELTREFIDNLIGISE